MDGDELRSILGETFGHELDDRRRLASVYGRLCKKLADSGILVVIATIAMFESVRKENRLSNEHYFEVFLDVPLDIRSERDPKGLYKAAAIKHSGNGENVLGLEEPLNPDLIIKNYGGTSPNDAASLIIRNYQIMANQKELATIDTTSNTNSNGEFELDRPKYWDSYYKKRKAPISPSTFALFCQENYLNKQCHILEFGCGNGRDSFYFSKKHRVTAIDESTVVVEANQLRASHEGILNIEFLKGEYGTQINGLPACVDVIYSRFVMHAMSEVAETRALAESWRLLKTGGKLFLEFRTILDPLMEMGIKLSETERKTDHYRRFIDFSLFCKKLEGIGFFIEYRIEKQGLATYGNDDPVVARIVAIKS